MRHGHALGTSSCSFPLLLVVQGSIEQISAGGQLTHSGRLAGTLPASGWHTVTCQLIMTQRLAALNRVWAKEVLALRQLKLRTNLKTAKNVTSYNDV